MKVRDACGLVTMLIVVATYAAGVAAPLELQDDHRIIAPALTPHPDGALKAWIHALHVDIVEVGRFRPVNQIFDVMGPLVLGANPGVWHWLLLVIAAAVTLLLFYAGAIAWSSPAAGVVFALVTMLAPDPGPTAAWYRLGPKEGWAMLFVAGALLLMVSTAGKGSRGLEIGTFVLVLLSAFSKEPFVLLVPAFLGIRVWLEAAARRTTVLAALRSLRLVAVSYAAVFLAGIAAIAYVVRSAGAHSYGARSLTLSWRSVGAVLLRDTLRAPTLAIWFVPVLVVLWLFWRRGEMRRLDLFAMLLFLAWVVPQYAMYGSRGGLWDHYWIPCVVGFAAIDAAAIAILAREPGSFAFKVAALATLIWLVNAIRIDGFAVWNFVERARVQQAAAGVAAKHLVPSNVLVIVSNYAEESERADAFADFVRYDGGRYRRALMYDSACKRCQFRDSMTGEVFGSIDPRDVGVVAFLDHDRPAPSLGNWYPRGDMQRVTVSAGQLRLSLRKRGIDRETFSLVLGIRRADRS